MLMIRQFPDLVSKLPGISARTLFVRAYCSFLKRGQKEGKDFLVPVMPILQPGEKGALLYPSLGLWKDLKCMICMVRKESFLCFPHVRLLGGCIDTERNREPGSKLLENSGSLWGVLDREET